MTPHDWRSPHRFVAFPTLLLFGLMPLASGCGGEDEAEAEPDDPDAPLTAPKPPTDPNAMGGFVDEDETNTSGDGPAGSGAAEDLTGDTACVGETKAAELLPPIIEVLLDTSGSMDWDAPGSNRNKWQVTRGAFEDAVEALPDSTALGMMFYPYPPDYNGPRPGRNGDCSGRPDLPIMFPEATVPIRKLSEAHRGIVTEEMSQVDPTGGTPTHAAYLYATEVLRASDIIGSKFLLLVTDGAPTYGLIERDGELQCVGNGRDEDRDSIPLDPLVDETARAADDGIRTFVIGSPGSEPGRNLLSRMARAGGTASDGCSDSGPNYCHFDMTEQPDFAQALSGALEKISGIARSCTYQLPEPPPGRQLDLGRVNVSFTPSGSSETQQISKDPSDGCSTGWQYTSDDSGIQLCGEWCDRAKNDPAAVVEILFGCRTNLADPR